MLAENYSYEVSFEKVSPTVSRVLAVITQKSTARVMTFSQYSFNDEGFVNHLESLTDACCDQWFPKEKKPTK